MGISYGTRTLLGMNAWEGWERTTTGEAEEVLGRRSKNRRNKNGNMAVSMQYYTCKSKY